jgi:hypothetical protein
LSSEPVDDEVAPVVEVVRLENPETSRKPKEGAPVRLGPLPTRPEPSRLDVPSRDELELRTHQPGIEVLIDSENSIWIPPEEGWGRNPRAVSDPLGMVCLIGLAIIRSGGVVAQSHRRSGCAGGSNPR